MSNSKSKLYLESLRTGDELPALQKTAIDRTQIVRFAAACGDFHPLYIDDSAARAVGLPSVCAQGLLSMGFMGQFMNEWLRGGQLSKLAIRFVKLVWPGDALTCHGRVLRRHRNDQGHYFVDIDLWAENQKGETILKGHATGRIFLNAEDEARQKRGEPPLIVDISEEREAPRLSKGRVQKPKPLPTEQLPVLRPPEPRPEPRAEAAPVALARAPEPHLRIVPKPAPEPKAMPEPETDVSPNDTADAIEAVHEEVEEEQVEKKPAKKSAAKIAASKKSPAKKSPKIAASKDSRAPAKKKAKR